MVRGKTIVVGGGAAGLMAAGRAAQRGSDVLLLEKMEQKGRKIGISGKGRCNVTNSAELPEFMTHFGKNGKFLRQCFQQYFSQELLTFFQEANLPLSLERGGRYFPESGRALDVVKVFHNWLEREKVDFRKRSHVSRIVVKDGSVTGVVCNNIIIETDNVILATGGQSYPRTGSSGDGYKLAGKVGHTITQLRPALVPLSSSDPSLASLKGLDLRNIEVRLFIDGKKKGQDFGELSFTPHGLSGATILSLSEQVVVAIDQGKQISISLDLKPALDEKKLNARLLRDLETRRGESIESILRGLLPKEFIAVCLNACDIPVAIDTSNFPAKMRKKLVHWFKDIRFEISGYRSWSEAIVTSGGISLKEIDPKTMESKLIKGLFIAGELLDLHADTGGFNLQAAFSTGWLAGSSVR
ncbi:MAG: aminoacetone oxidase family FAD-binding enzyme [Desulfotalea sp.]|nr:MAG: aminoacetone oxidase family FAD-binding enzyme [Desulfotalea sp.]